MPEIQVRQCFHTCSCPVITPIVVEFDFLRPFPIINIKRPVTIVAKYHIDRPRDFHVLVVDHPFRTIRFQPGKIRDKSLEIRIFDAIILHIHSVVVTFNVVMHLGTCAGGRYTIILPLFLNVGPCFSVIFVFGVGHLFIRQNFINDGVLVEMGELLVYPGGDRGIRPAFSHHGINMRSFFKGNIHIPWMGVFESEFHGRTGAKRKFGQIFGNGNGR